VLKLSSRLSPPVVPPVTVLISVAIARCPTVLPPATFRVEENATSCWCSYNEGNARQNFPLVRQVQALYHNAYYRRAHQQTVARFELYKGKYHDFLGSRPYRRQMDPYRNCERARLKYFHNHNPGSRSHGLHSQYPLRLRSMGDFIRGTPSMEDRELQHNISLLRDQVQSLIRTIKSLRTPHVHSAAFDREGGGTAITP
jgi:hypothetical protein